jgi:hypothetical protein
VYFVYSLYSEHREKASGRRSVLNRTGPKG